VQTAVALVRWGPTPAAAYTINAARYPDEVGIVDEAGTLTFLEIQRPTNAPAHPFRDAGDAPGVARIATLTVSALAVLIAPPLYLLLDLAVVGRLGGEQLAALGVGTLVLSIVSTPVTFLSYGPTARSARPMSSPSDRVNVSSSASMRPRVKFRDAAAASSRRPSAAALRAAASRAANALSVPDSSRRRAAGRGSWPFSCW